MKLQIDKSKDSNCDKIAEVTAFVRLYGYSIDQACELAGLDRRDYRPERSVMNVYVPTPTIIQSECTRFKTLHFDPTRVVDRSRVLQFFDEGSARLGKPRWTESD